MPIFKKKKKNQQVSLAQEKRVTKDRVLTQERKRKKLRFFTHFWMMVRHRRWHAADINRKNKGLIMACFAMILFSFVILTLAPQFYVKNFRVEGNYFLKDSEILRLSGIKESDHLFKGFGMNLDSWLRLRYRKIENRLKNKLSYIDEVKVSIDLPSTVVIHVKERAEVAFVKTQSGGFVVDKDGIVLDIIDELPSFVPIIEGIALEKIEVGEKISVEFKEKVNDVILILDAVLQADETSQDGFDFFSKIKRLRTVDNNVHYMDVELMSENVLTVRIGQLTNINNEIYWLRGIYKKDLLESLGNGLLDIRDGYSVFSPAKKTEMPVIESEEANEDGEVDENQENTNS